MIISFDDDQIRISNIGDEVKSNVLFQLQSWGFQRNSDTLISVPKEESKILLLKVLGYLNKRSVNYEIAEECKGLFNRLLESEKYFSALFAKASDLKDGKYDVEKYQEFSDYVSSNIPRQLKPHQLKASFHHLNVKNEANFSVPGSGKTTTVLTVYKKLKDENKVNMLFVVGPPACFGPWKKEFKLTLGYEPGFHILSGLPKDHRLFTYSTSSSNTEELFLITFHSAFNDSEDIKKFFKRDDIKPMLVIDEAHYIKQLGGNWARAILSFCKFAEYRCVLTGTPMPKSYVDVFNLYDFLWPDQEVISEATRINIQSLEQSNQIERAKDELKVCIGPLFYRVRKSDLGLMEPNFHDPIRIKMNNYESKIYNAVITRIRHFNNDDYLRNIGLVDRLRRGRMIRLRQCVSYVSLLSSAIENYPESLIDESTDLGSLIRKYDSLEKPAKYEYLFKLVKDLTSKGEKIIVWANFVKTIEMLRDNFLDTGVKCKIIYGKTPIENSTVEEAETREKIIEEFLDVGSGLDVLVANPAACAESISLHKTCHNAVYYDLSYNCAQYLQSLDRIHRVGGSERIEANYYFLQYENTIDEDIKNNLDSKATRMMLFVDDEYGIYSLDMLDDDNDDLDAYKRIFKEPNNE